MQLVKIIDVPSAIANELFVVDRIFKNTRYIHIIEHVMRVVALNIKETYRLSWTDAWDILRFIFNDVKVVLCQTKPWVIFQTISVDYHFGS